MGVNRISTKTRYVDFDGTLAYFDKWMGWEHLGEPVEKMVSRVKNWINQGDRVIIHTARFTPSEDYCPANKSEDCKKLIKQWCIKNIGFELEVTNLKGAGDCYYDDRAVSVLSDTGITMEEHLYEQGKKALAGAFESPERAMDEFQQFVNFLGRLAEVRK
jgi:hypothetical protein